MEVVAVLFLATAIALLRRTWPALALLAALWFTLCMVSLGFLGMAIPCLLLAQAVALRWRVGALGEFALLLVAVVVWAIGGLGSFALRGGPPLYWMLFVGLLAGFVALAWNRPPWGAASSVG